MRRCREDSSRVIAISATRRRWRSTLSPWRSFFNVFNSRSDRRSAFVDFFSNHWVWAALGLSLVLQVLVIYVPVLQKAFGTTALTPGDWLRCLGAASMVLWTREILKVFLRMRPARTAG